MNWIKKYYPTIAISILIFALFEIGARFIFSEIPKYDGGYNDDNNACKTLLSLL